MTTTRQLLTAAAAMALLTSTALAQVHQVQMGGSMDANPGVGSYGANRPVQGFVPINGNDIMSGNVSGLSYFHGRSATINNYQQGGSFGNNSFNNFIRQSAGSSNYSTYTGQAQSFYIPANTVSTAQGALYSAPIGSGFDSALVPRSSISPAANNLQLSRVNVGLSNNGQAIDRTVSATPLQPGDPGTILSSPLFILRTTEVQARRVDLSKPTLPPGMNNGAANNPNGLNGDVKTTPATEPATQPANPDMVQGMVSGGLDQRIASQTPEFKSAMVSENYIALASELNKIKGVTPEDKNNTTVSLTTANTSDADPLTGLPRKISTLPSFNSKFPNLGTTAVGTRPSTTQASNQNPGALPPPKRLTNASDTELQAGGRVKPVHISPTAPSGSAGVPAFDMLMAKAETSLKANRYLDAAEAYQTALTIKPDDPLALVGRAHAEMAAGIYAAAEYDLKFVFSRKPDLVSVKYDVDSFIPASRQEFLLEDLKKLSTAKETAGMANFLFCYLCYQTGRSTQLQADLKTWADSEARDDWQVIAQRAWKGKANDQP